MYINFRQPLNLESPFKILQYSRVRNRLILLYSYATKFYNCTMHYASVLYHSIICFFHHILWALVHLSQNTHNWSCKWKNLYWYSYSVGTWLESSLYKYIDIPVEPSYKCKWDCMKDSCDEDTNHSYSGSFWSSQMYTFKWPNLTEINYYIESSFCGIL